MNESEYVPAGGATTADGLADLLNGGLWTIACVGLSVVPVVSCVGVVCNIVIVLIMPWTSGVKRKARLFYVSIAFFDNFPLISFHLLSIFSGNALLQVSSGSVYFFQERISSASCKVNRYFEYAGEAASNMLVAAFTLERCVAVSAPFLARFFTFRRSAAAIGALVTFSFALEGCTLYFIDLKGSGYGLTPYCNVQQSTLNRVLLFVALQTAYVVPIAVIAVCNTIMYVALRKRVPPGANAAKLAKSHATARVMLVIACIHFVVLCPYGVLYTTYMVLPSSSSATLLRYAANVCLEFSSICHSVNFFVYFVNIPAFRQQVLCR